MGSIAGTNGIPLERERVYVQIDWKTGFTDDGRTYEIPMRLEWPDGRSWAIESLDAHREYGRPFLGNPVERFDVRILGLRKTFWRERGECFVAARGPRLVPQRLSHDLAPIVYDDSGMC